MPVKKTMRKKAINGNGLMDTLKNIYNKGTELNKYLKEKQYASRALKNFGELKNIPYLNTVLQTAADYGYGAKKPGKQRAPRMTANSLLGMTKA